MFSRFFIHRPVFACVISILVIILGGVSYFALPVDQYPDIAPPIVHVDASYPGANAQTIADTIASPIEQSVNGVDRMIYMNSTSTDGHYGLDVSFEPGTDIDMAAVLVQNRVNSALAKLPEEARRLGVTTNKQSTAFVAVLSLYSPDKSRDDLFLVNYMARAVQDRIARVYGVGGSVIYPSKEYAMRVWLDPERMKLRGLTVDDVNAAVREQNVQVAAGAIGRPPMPEGVDFEMTINTLGRFTTAEQFENIIVKTGENGQGIVRLKDIAKVELGTRDYSTISRFNNQPSAILIVFQLPGANLTSVSADVAAEFEKVKAEFPSGVDGKIFYDASMFIRSSMNEVITTLIEAFILVALVVLVFLQSWRTAIIPLITIPVSLIGTFLVMYMLGFSINMLTMFGIVLAIGIVVDDAIVVVENVERNLRETNLEVHQATDKAMHEIFSAVIAITLVLMSVFLPAASLPGVTGTMYRQFALTIAAATFFSALNALTLSPALCAVLLKGHGSQHHRSRLRDLVGAPARLFNRSFERLANAYAWFSRITGKVAIIMLGLLAGMFVLTLFVLRQVPTGFVPDEDLGFVVVAISLPDGASLQRTEAVVNEVAERIKDIDGIAATIQFSGFSLIQGSGGSFGNIFVTLDDYGARAKSGRTSRKIMDDLNAKVADIQEASFLVFSLPAIRGLGVTSGFDMRVLDTQDAGLGALGNAVGEVLAAANGQPNIAYAYSTFRSGVPQLFLDIDREKIIRLGVPLNEVFVTLQTYLGASYVNDFNLFNRTYQVNLQAEARFRTYAQDVLKLEVRNNDGVMVPLGAVMSIRDSLGPNVITRYNLFPSAGVNGSPKPGVSSGESLSTMEQVAAKALPQGMSFEWSSMSYQEKLTSGSASAAVGLAILLVYLILAAQYESWTTPLAVVLSVPLVIIGAALALDWRGLDNNIFTQIGLVLLIGLGAKNAILIVEFARQNRAGGMGIIQSAVEAARTRLRPILMTSFAFILGVVPLVIATGAGAASRQSLGTAVFGGMIGATILGLIFTPALYVAVTSTTEFVRGLFYGKGESKAARVESAEV